MAFGTFGVRTGNRTEFVDVTRQVSELVDRAGTTEGLCLVTVPHTTAGITVNEAADPSVQRDMLKELNKVIPFEDAYAHLEGNSAAHIKTSLTGSSVTLPIHEGRLVLGTWQGIYFCEFDGPRNRTVHVQIVAGA